MPPQHDGTLQDGHVPDAARTARLEPCAARRTAGTNHGALASFEVSVELLRSEDLLEDLECWQIEERFATIAVHEHGFLLLVRWIARIL
jgi:hypothetical protein